MLSLQIQKWSVFSTKWYQEYIHLAGGMKTPRICHVDVKSIVGHVLMIPYNKEKDSYIQIWDKSLWGNEFYEC